MGKKLTVWIDNSPGGFEWILGRMKMAHVYSTKESIDFIKVTLTIPSRQKKVKKKK